MTETTPPRPASRTDGASDGDADSDVLARIDRYFDRLPLLDGHAEVLGPVVVFVRDAPGPPRSAKPLRGRTVRAADVAAARTRFGALGLPESFEWVHEAAPTMRDAVSRAGLAVMERPLLALPDAGAETPGLAVPDVPTVPAVPAVPAGVDVRVLAADDPALPTAVAVPRLAFADIGTHVGTANVGDLAATAATAAVRREARRIGGLIGAGRMTVVAAVRDGVALGSGLFPGVVEGTAEVCAVGTLPAARRQGLALAVTAALAGEARRGGATTVFLSATDDAVARLYARAGFRRVGTFLEAEPPAVTG